MENCLDSLAHQVLRFSPVPDKQCLVADALGNDLLENAALGWAWVWKMISSSFRKFHDWEISHAPNFTGSSRRWEHSRTIALRRGDSATNSAESFFAVLKRGVNGVYHSVSKKHLHRYLSEFEFRYNRRKWEGGDRTVAPIQGGIGKRLLYREPVKANELHFTNS